MGMCDPAPCGPIKFQNSNLSFQLATRGSGMLRSVRSFRTFSTAKPSKVVVPPNVTRTQLLIDGKFVNSLSGKTCKLCSRPRLLSCSTVLNPSFVVRSRHVQPGDGVKGIFCDKRCMPRLGRAAVPGFGTVRCWYGGCGVQTVAPSALGLEGADKKT